MMTQNSRQSGSGRRGRIVLDRPDEDTSGQYGSLDPELGYGGGCDPGNLGHYGRETTTHNYREDDVRDELGWEEGLRPDVPEEKSPEAHERPRRPGDPRR